MLQTFQIQVKYHFDENSKNEAHYRPQWNESYFRGRNGSDRWDHWSRGHEDVPVSL